MQRPSSLPVESSRNKGKPEGEASTENQRPMILVVDDDELTRRTLARTLGDTFEVRTIATVTEALADIARRSYAAIVCDIELPDGSGTNLLAQARHLGSDVPFIFVTGHPTVETATAALNLGAIRYLTKPINSDEIMESVKRAVMLHELGVLRARTNSLPPVEGDPAVEDERRLYRALKGIWMAFQPIVSWRQRTVVGYEALLRTQEPSLARPLDLIACAERHAKIDELGKSVRAKIAECIAEAPHQHRIFVNLHSRDLINDDLFDQDAPLSQYASRIVLEITERASLDVVDDLSSRLNRLRRMGYSIAVDDLGAGYAGLSSVVRLEPQVVKFDMSLVRGIVDNHTKQQLVQSMSRVCRELGMAVVVEGVETDLEAYTLARLGCDLFQGYCFARPARGFPEPQFPTDG